MTNFQGQYIGFGSGSTAAPDPEALGDTVSASTGRYFYSGVPHSRGLHGAGTTGTSEPYISSPTQLGSDTDWQMTDFNNSMGHALRNSGQLWAWGYNHYGQLGIGTSGASHQIKTSPVQVGSESDWIHCANSKDTGFGIRSGGTLWSWGQGTGGTLGDGTTNNTSSPAQIGPSGGWTWVSAATKSICAIQDGKLFTWGYNNYGQLGHGNTTDISSPVQIGSSTGWTKCSSSGASMAGIDGGKIFVWGYAGNGQKGDGTTTNVSSPVQVGSATNWTDITMWNGCVALNSAGELWSWGYGGAGKLGHGNTTSLSTPAQIGAETYWESISMNANGLMARRTDGKLYVCGANYYATFFGASGATSGTITSPTLMGGTEGGAVSTYISMKCSAITGYEYAAHWIY